MPARLLLRASRNIPWLLAIHPNWLFPCSPGAGYSSRLLKNSVGATRRVAPASWLCIFSVKNGPIRAKKSFSQPVSLEVYARSRNIREFEVRNEKRT